MPSHAAKTTSSAISTLRQPQKTCTAHEYVARYTEQLAMGTNRAHALQRLLQIDCSIKVFEECTTEEVLRKHQMPQYDYLVNKLTQKLSALRRREVDQAQKRLEKKGELTAHISFTEEFVEHQKKLMDQKSQHETNRLFASALGCKTKASKVKVDYSKFKITKRSHSTSSTSSTSSKSSSVSP